MNTLAVITVLVVVGLVIYFVSKKKSTGTVVVSVSQNDAWIVWLNANTNPAWTANDIAFLNNVFIAGWKSSIGINAPGPQVAWTNWLSPINGGNNILLNEQSASVQTAAQSAFIAGYKAIQN